MDAAACFGEGIDRFGIAGKFFAANVRAEPNQGADGVALLILGYARSAAGHVAVVNTMLADDVDGRAAANEQGDAGQQDQQANFGLGSNDHVRKTPRMTTQTVCQMMTRSSRKEMFSTYSMSYLIHSWKSIPRRRVRRTCQRPVTPGRTERRASRQGGQY